VSLVNSVLANLERTGAAGEGEFKESTRAVLRKKRSWVPLVATAVIAGVAATVAAMFVAGPLGELLTPAPTARPVAPVLAARKPAAAVPAVLEPAAASPKAASATQEVAQAAVPASVTLAPAPTPAQAASLPAHAPPQAASAAARVPPPVQQQVAVAQETAKTIAEPKKAASAPPVPAALKVAISPAAASAPASPQVAPVLRSAPAQAPASASTQAATAPAPATVQATAVPAGPPAKTISRQQESENLYREGAVFMQQGRNIEAVDSFSRSLQVEPGNVTARLALANLSAQRGQVAEALATLEEGRKASPGNVELASLAARFELERGNAPRALELLESEVPADRRDARFHALEAVVFQRLARHEEAVSHFLSALSTNPAMPNWLVGIGISLRALGRDRDALEAFDRAQRTGLLSGQVAAFVDEQIKSLAR
jgi:MSHA biogenesis protein MshN